MSYYDRASEKCITQRGYARKTTAYNAIGNVTEEAYYDTNGNLTDTSMGYAKVEYIYDELGNMTAKRYMDAASVGVVPESELYARSQMEYDDQGRLTSEAYFDEKDRPALCKEGYASRSLSPASLPRGCFPGREEAIRSSSPS